MKIDVTRSRAGFYVVLTNGEGERRAAVEFSTAKEAKAVAYFLKTSSDIVQFGAWREGWQLRQIARPANQA